jgi:penicillin-insensitive murein endopeptidase
MAIARTVALLLLIVLSITTARAQSSGEALPWLPEKAVVPKPVPAKKPPAADKDKKEDALPAAREAEKGPGVANDAVAAQPKSETSGEPAKDAKDNAPGAAAPRADAATAEQGKKAAKAKAEPARKLFGAAKLAADLKPRAIGTYAKGCLAGGEALAIDGPAWQAMRLSRNRNWGHPKLIALLERFATEMTTRESWPGLLIGDLAQPRGGPMLSGHKSHQLGLDADIWFRPMPSQTLPVAERETFEPLLLAEEKGTEVIAANWNDGFTRLVKRAASYPEVERIFVHPAIKKKFCETAGNDKSWLSKVRPMWLHNYHFHVRMRCPADSAACEAQKPTTGEDGCGKEVEDWIKLVSRPAKPQPPAQKPAKPPPPKPEIMLDQLPPECKTVLAAGDKKPDQEEGAVAAAPENVPDKSRSAQK